MIGLPLSKSDCKFQGTLNVFRYTVLDISTLFNVKSLQHHAQACSLLVTGFSIFPEGLI